MKPTPAHPKSRAPALAALILVLGLLTAAAPGQTAADCLILSGLGGMPEYEENFLRWAEKTEAVCGGRAGSRVRWIDGRKQRKPEILAAFEEISRSPDSGELWLFLIGHASHGSQGYRFNIRGPDLTDAEIGAFLDGLGERRIQVIAATGASGALVEGLEGPNRVIVTATKSGTEKQPPLFMSFFLEAVEDEKADLDKNERVSIYEAFTFSRQKVSEWFEGKNRIQTEHALLADNGASRLGRDKESEDGIQAGSLLASAAYLSGRPARSHGSAQARELEAQRLTLEREVEDLRFRKQQMSEEEYYRSLETLMLRLARLDEAIRALEESP